MTPVGKSLYQTVLSSRQIGLASTPMTNQAIAGQRTPESTLAILALVVAVVAVLLFIGGVAFLALSAVPVSVIVGAFALAVVPGALVGYALH